MAPSESSGYRGYEWCKKASLKSVVIPFLLFVVGYLSFAYWNAPRWHVKFFQYLVYHSASAVTVGLALSAIFYAATQTVTLNLQYEKIKDVHSSIASQLTQLELVSESLSTYRIGPFPRYLRDIGKLVRESECGDHLDFLVDCLDYGSFFRPAVHAIVHHQIHLAIQRGVAVRMIVCGPVPQHLTEVSGRAAQRFGDQWPKIVDRYNRALVRDVDFSVFLGSFRNSSKVDDFVAKWFQSPDEISFRETLIKFSLSTASIG